MEFAEALAQELAWFAAQTPGRTVSSVFFGGGTPSLMPPSAVRHVLDAIGSNWGVAPDCEITLEVNPTSVEARNFAGYRAAGVNRVSVGVQALDDDALRALGRQHSVEEALEAFRSHLCAAASDAGIVAWRACSRAWRADGAHVALSADHRARHRVRRSPGARCLSNAK
jgi:oxygen-independent coproporphyrinogen-3 oxidase